MADDAQSSLLQALREAIADQGEKVQDVFKKLDSDGSGSLSRKEFGEGILGLGLAFTPEAAAIDGAPAACRALSPARPSRHRHRLLPQRSSLSSTRRALAPSSTSKSTRC